MSEKHILHDCQHRSGLGVCARHISGFFRPNLHRFRSTVGGVRTSWGWIRQTLIQVRRNSGGLHATVIGSIQRCLHGPDLVWAGLDKHWPAFDPESDVFGSTKSRVGSTRNGTCLTPCSQVWPDAGNFLASRLADTSSEDMQVPPPRLAQNTVCPRFSEREDALDRSPSVVTNNSLPRPRPLAPAPAPAPACEALSGGGQSQTRAAATPRRDHIQDDECLQGGSPQVAVRSATSVAVLQHSKSPYSLRACNIRAGVTPCRSSHTGRNGDLLDFHHPCVLAMMQRLPPARGR